MPPGSGAQAASANAQRTSTPRGTSHESSGGTAGGGPPASVSDDRAAGHLLVQAAGDAAGHEGRPPADGRRRRPLGPGPAFRTAGPRPAALIGVGTAEDGVIERMHGGRLPVGIGCGAARVLARNRWTVREVAGGGALPATGAKGLGREQDGATRRAAGGHGATLVVARDRHQVLLTSRLSFGRSGKLPGARAPGQYGQPLSADGVRIRSG